MKNTAKPVTDLPFPAITICASGLHMDNVGKKLEENFAQWRMKNSRNDNKKEAIEKDIEEYMWTTFQIQPKEETDSQTKPANILDILDTMIAPKEASVAANAIRENVFACEDFTQRNNQANATAKRKKRSTSCENSCTNSCMNTQFTSQYISPPHRPQSIENF